MSDSSQEPLTPLEEVKQRIVAKFLPPHMRFCGNCEHFQAEGQNGYCFKNPPVAMMGMAPNPRSAFDQNAPPMQAVLQGVYPPTHPKKRRCGAWEMATKGSG